MSDTLTQIELANQDFLTLAATSLASAPNLTEIERTTRFQTVMRGTMAFRPTDPAQTLLASLILGHHLTIMDGFRDIACLALPPAEAARARMVTVAQTKLLLQLVRELRITREAALTPAADQSAADQPAARAGEPHPRHAGDAEAEVSLARFMSACTETLATLKNSDPVTPDAAARAREALGQALPPALFAMPSDAEREAQPVTKPVIASRAQRRAMMKQRGGFKRTS